MNWFKDLFGLSGSDDASSKIVESDASWLGINQIHFLAAFQEKDYQRAFLIFENSLLSKDHALDYQRIYLIPIYKHLQLFDRLVQLCNKLIENATAQPQSQHIIASLMVEKAIGLASLYLIDQASEVIRDLETFIQKDQFISPQDITIKLNEIKERIESRKEVSEDFRKEEAQLYKVLEDKQEDVFSIAGSDIYIIPTNWIQKWKEYTGYKSQENTEAMVDETTEPKKFAQLYPGPILIDEIIDQMKMPAHTVILYDRQYIEASYVINTNCIQERDFVMLSSDLADYFYSRYGGIKLKRQTILNPITNELQVDLYYKRITFIPSPTLVPSQKLDTLYVLYISKYDSLRQLNQKIKRTFKSLPSLKQSIYNRQYFRFLRLSKQLNKDYFKVQNILVEKYKDKHIFIDVKENNLDESSLVDDLETSTTDILIFEQSDTSEFKIRAIKKIHSDGGGEEQEEEEEEEQRKNKDSMKESQSSLQSKMQEESNFEEQGTYPTGRIRIRKIDEEHVKQMKKKFGIKTNGKGITGKKGLAGLQNLGNTCFMNSSLQCLSNVEELTNFLINNEFVNDLNIDNPLGARGMLAVAYADLMREMWQGTDSYVSAHSLKKVIGKFAPQFIGYNQQDSQELLSYLLDGLHEDLNRVKKKPVVETIDYCGGDDEKFATEFFKNYKKRNDSVISDLMVGQFKSTLTCPNTNCKKISIIFDPFLSLSVPIPSTQLKPKIITEQVSFYFVYKDYRRIPSKITFTIRSDITIKDLKEIISDQLNIPIQCLLVATVNKLKIEKIFTNDKLVNTLKEAEGVVFVYEINNHASGIIQFPEQITSTIKVEECQIDEQTQTQNSFDFKDSSKDEQQNIQVEVQVYQINSKNIEGESWKVASGTIQDTCSFSRLLQVPTTSTVGDLCLKMYQVLRWNFDNYKKQYTSPLLSHVAFNIVDEQHLQLYKELKEFSIKSPLFAFSSNDGSQINEDSQENVLSLKIEKRSRIQVKLLLSKDFELKFLKAQRCETFEFDLKKFSALTGADSIKQNNDDGNQRLSLIDCIEAFVRVEKLEQGNEWYCNGCKKHVCATKQMQIYKTPKILIIHLKRFKSGNMRNFGKYFYESGGKKINCHVDFPIENLCMTQYVLGDNKPQVYDLFAVSQHFGGMGGGHYTACAKNFVQDKWYNYNDSHVSPSSPDQAVSSAAYVLFYRRRD